MESFFNSTLAVAIAEIGDKTQLLALFLAARYLRPYVITAGVLVATIFNHALSAWLGTWVASLIPPHWIPWIISGSFIAIALWILIPDKADDELGRFAQYGPFFATLVLFFLAEMGDKTQIATVVLAAKYNDNLLMTISVIAGTTLGMLLANVPVIFFGKRIMDKMPLNVARQCALVLFLLFALMTLVAMKT